MRLYNYNYGQKTTIKMKERERGGGASIFSFTLAQSAHMGCKHKHYIASRFHVLSCIDDGGWSSSAIRLPNQPSSSTLVTNWDRKQIESGNSFGGFSGFCPKHSPPIVAWSSNRNAGLFIATSHRFSATDHRGNAAAFAAAGWHLDGRRAAAATVAIERRLLHGK